MSAPTIDIAVVDHVAQVRMNRPEKHNALDGQLMTELRDASREIASNASVRAVVLAGEGKSFCAGLDTANFATMMSGDLSADSENVKQTYADLSPAGANRAQQTGWLWQELAVPVIAAVQGSALGGGLNLALAADITVMAADAKLGFVEIGWGLMPDMSASQSLRRLVGADRAKLLVLTGQIFSGAEAHAWGLATELADDPVGRATEIAQAIAANNPDAVRAALRVLNHSVDSDTTAGFAEETRVSSALIGGANQIEAVRARLSNEPANFEDSPRP